MDRMHARRSRGSSHGPATFFTQADALLRKNITFQKRNRKTNFRLVAFPSFLCLIMITLQAIVNNELDKPIYTCGCKCIDIRGDGSCENVCGLRYSTFKQVPFCPIATPQKWPALLQVPNPNYRASRTDLNSFSDFPDCKCKDTGTCPVTILFTGEKRLLATRLAANLVMDTFPVKKLDLWTMLSEVLPATDTKAKYTNFIEPAFLSDHPLYIVQPKCVPNFNLSIPIKIVAITHKLVVQSVQILHLWRNSSSDVNKELFKGYEKGNSEKQINEIPCAYDFLDSDEIKFNVNIWYNATKSNGLRGPLPLIRLPHLLNMASNAYLQFLIGAGVRVLIDFVKEMPKPGTKITLDFSSVLGPLFFTWIVELLLPVILTYLVYEKQQNLRIMMKMHGLGDGPYWIISYSYFLIISLAYIYYFFTLNNYSVQFVFYFIYVNLQILLSFLVATIFSEVKTATVVGYIYVFGSGLLGAFLFQFFIEDMTFSRIWVLLMEIFPGFSLFRGLYELAQYSFAANYMGADGMQWKDFNDDGNGMLSVLIIMLIEWIVLLPLAYYLDQVASSGSGIRKHPLCFLQSFRKKRSPSFRRLSLQREGSKVFIDMEKSDVSREREVVKQLLRESSTSHAIICDNLRKVYPGKDGNSAKYAVRGLSLALPRGECFGMLGTNGAGKTTFINMMIGLISPTSGHAYIEGLEIWTDIVKYILAWACVHNMSKRCSSLCDKSRSFNFFLFLVGCLFFVLLWETLTGRERLLFYAVDESLKSLNLYNGGFGDKRAGNYSAGMKRRLSVASSLIGNPQVVYLDEPSTGLDPTSRNSLWSVIKSAKRDRAIILTSRCSLHLDGTFECLGNPKETAERLVSRTSTVGVRFTTVGALSSPKHVLLERMCLECQSDISRMPKRPMQLPLRYGSKACIVGVPFETAGAHCLQNVYCRSDVSSVLERPMQLSKHCGSRHVLPECPLRLPERIFVKKRGILYGEGNSVQTFLCWGVFAWKIYVWEKVRQRVWREKVRQEIWMGYVA
ncbi:hypothetical protein AMTRI_Chr05g65180 [Amborella trichopoda]